MPRPYKGEDQDTFMARCIAQAKEEGIEGQDARVGRCMGLWEEGPEVAQPSSYNVGSRVMIDRGPTRENLKPRG